MGYSVVGVCWLAIFIKIVTGQNSPCPRIFEFRHAGGQTYGVLTLNVDPETIRIDIIVRLTYHTDQTISTGTITNLDSDEDVLDTMAQGGPLKFRVSFKQFNPVVRIKDIIYNQREVCKNSPDATLPLSTLTIKQHITFSDDSATTVVRPINQSKYKCGTLNIKDTLSPLISHGDETTIEEWPWLAALIRNGDNEFFCGGTVISKNYILTAAHCVTRPKQKKVIDPKTIKAILGSTSISDDSEEYRLERAIRYIRTHEEYSGKTLRNDIAMLKVNTMTFNDGIIPICISDENFSQNNGNVVGWGKDEYGALSDKLLKVKIPTISSDRCKRSNNIFKKYVWNKNFCAGGTGKGPCNGDSGGGFYNNKGKKWYIRGIVSFNMNNEETQCDNDNYAVFTNVLLYKTWIENTKVNLNRL